MGGGGNGCCCLIFLPPKNIDTDTQWAYWDGVRAFEAKNHGYLQVGGGVVEVDIAVAKGEAGGEVL